MANQDICLKVLYVVTVTGEVQKEIGGQEDINPSLRLRKKCPEFYLLINTFAKTSKVLE